MNFNDDDEYEDVPMAVIKYSKVESYHSAEEKNQENLVNNKQEGNLYNI